MKRLFLSKAILFICDIQEAFRPRLSPLEAEVLFQRCNFLNQYSKILEIPRVVTEQYPKGLGRTVPEIVLESTPESRVYKVEKTKFSMMTEEVESLDCFDTRNQILLCGLEAHVCVMQTTLDLIEKGFDVFVIADAVISQRSYDRKIALDRMKESGAIITTAESALFDLLRDSKHPKFRMVSQLIKETNLKPWINLDNASDLIHDH